MQRLMLDLPVPTAVFHNISVKPSEIQKQMVAELAERAERVRNGMVDASATGSAICRSTRQDNRITHEFTIFSKRI